ncbi:2-dehydropantoate 2-reductase [Ensifer adhaerens]|uniref:2-dehydropantoate 2-reductase n=1 Tax=Ensifer adhaerens TaxID=106592 RepID=UPI001CBAEFCF|nr:2-dehydropantoate 2-reductase [Ensifer adhaerens]MBZ7924530.1 2-dehydropantoate 2-reductase [Ensifer adhaerens]UAX96231.1 2-dehydropantoate 2-reductase [Ensifer adhaerens]UAY04426.1 2-dehydropantoate 2-reductase [Ensifer adhaerens]UAY09858.1 2-dehydropantoate 2-reductase [Ensifer adhaerens]
MKIGVFGAGAVGGFVGGCLLAGGAEVTFVGRTVRGAAWQREGLRLTDLDGRDDFVAPERIAYSDAASSLAGCDLILLTVKSGQTVEAAAELSPVLRTGVPVLSLQNGVGNSATLQALLPSAKILRGIVPFNVTTPGPAHLHRATEGNIAAEDDPLMAAAAALFKAAGLDLDLRRDMEAVQWAKLLMNLNNAINALSGLPLREQLQTRGFRQCLALAQREALGLLATEGRIQPARLTPLPPNWLPLILRLPDAPFRAIAGRMLKIDATARSSMADDLAAGRFPEVDWINGAVATLAVKLGRRAPVNERLCALVKEAATTGRKTWAADALLAELRRSVC